MVLPPKTIDSLDALAMEVDHSLPGARVVRVLEPLKERG